MNENNTVITKEDLQNYTVKSLLQLAKKFNIAGRHDMRKDKLISSICEALESNEEQAEKNTATSNNTVTDNSIVDGEEQGEEKVEIVFRRHNSGKTREDYINDVQKNQIIAFAMTDEKAFSAKVIEIVRNAKKELNYVLCETRNGTKYKVPASRILWVKTRDKWPCEVLDMLKNNTKIDGLNN